MPAKNQTQRIDELLGGVTEELLLGNPQQFEDNSIRVERLLLEMVRPDPVQPRRVLPEPLDFAFHSSRLTPTQALKQLVQLVQVAARQRGRPFNNVLELLANPDDGRYWATWLLRDFVPGSNSDGMIPCIIIPAERSSVFRQAKENTARSGLSAIAMARQAALLLLTVHGYEIPSHAVSNDFYRQALELDLRGKGEYTEAVLSAMGGIKRGQFSYIKGLLRLSDEALELADRQESVPVRDCDYR
ncbi:MAG: hypothetical protein OHK0023_13870 [Anaerolineae bacterium]